jgi:hypothetical protein
MGSNLLARWRSSRARRLAIALFAVPAILIGLLAMHVLVPAHHTSDAAVVHGSAGVMAAAASPSAPVPAEDCGGMCGPSHEMLGVICVLALLVTVLLLTLQPMLTRWEQLRRTVSAIVAKAAALAHLPPPSLHVLSISRT